MHSHCHCLTFMSLQLKAPIFIFFSQLSRWSPWLYQLEYPHIFLVFFQSDSGLFVFFMTTNLIVSFSLHFLLQRSVITHLTLPVGDNPRYIRERDQWQCRVPSANWPRHIFTVSIGENAPRPEDLQSLPDSPSLSLCVLRVSEGPVLSGWFCNISLCPVTSLQGVRCLTLLTFFLLSKSLEQFSVVFVVVK